MEALEFLKERKRMCSYYVSCIGCPLVMAKCFVVGTTSDEDCERIIATVETWSKEHPRKTRQSVFLEHFPEAEMTKDGVISICPVGVSAAYRDDHGYCANPSRHCADCRKEYWTQEVKDDG